MSTTPNADGTEESKSPQGDARPTTPGYLICRHCGGAFLPEGLGARWFHLCPICIKTDPKQRRP